MRALSVDKVVFIGELPPPIGGKSLVNKYVHSALQPQCDLLTINLSSGRLERTLAYHIQRVVRVFRGLGTIARAGRHQRVYLSVDAGLGLVYAILLIAFARLARHSIFLHHHSFLYLDRRTRLMAMLVAVTGRDACHIFICSRMKRLFEDRYGLSKGVICSNAHFVEPQQTRRKVTGRSFRIGLLSHLNADKGLHDFLALLRAANEKGLSVTGILAGPPTSKADAAAIAKAQTEFGHDCLDYRGPVFGEAKERFYREIDAFVFPTRFRVEAQGLVVLEALSYGVPVIAFGRGCIQELSSDAVSVVPPETNFVAAATPVLQRWLAEPEQHEAAQGAAIRLSDRLHAEADANFRHLLSLLTGR
jgi:glycosyltransferase involved in cell wall biosynthesis